MLEKVDSNLLAPDLRKLVGKPKELHQQLVVNLQRQLEFYLGDPNLLRDKVLVEKITSSKKRFIEIDTFLSFSRIKEFFEEVRKPSKEERRNFLIRAVRRSQMLRISNNEVYMRRAVPFSTLKLTSTATKRD